MGLTSHYENFINKYGYFSEDGYEYIITRPDTPRPWTNVISNGDFGLIVSQAGGGFTWRTHVNLNRLTRWNQDLIRDDWGKWLYLRDIDSGEFRSLAFQPVQAYYDEYIVRHGLGYTTFFQKTDDFETEWTQFVALNEPVEIWLCTIRNLDSRKRRLQLASYLEWTLGAGPDNQREFHKLFIQTSYDPVMRGILATKSVWEVPSDRGHWNTEWPYVGFHSVNMEVAGWDTSKDALIGRHGSFQNPRGIRAGHFSKADGHFEDSSASLATNIELEALEEKSLVFLLGQVDKEGANQKIPTLVAEYGNVDCAVLELEKVKRFWRDLAERMQVQTPDASFDLLTNIWLKYQAISGHLWSRTGYYQQSGAFGFRDQLQTSQIWLPLEPGRMLEQIDLHARHQLEDGTVLHWWHPLTDQGLATDMTDDLLWLPFMLTRYCNEVGDHSILSELLPYYKGGEATLQEHCIRAIDVCMRRFSERGLPLMGAGDWCDGFSAVGLDWKGESIWLGMFLYSILKNWSEILKDHSPIPDKDLADKYQRRADELKTAINAYGWNGNWYIAATKDDGTPLGDPSQEECQIYLNTQTWAIISGVAEEERREKITQAMLQYLECDNGLMLFTPAFKESDKNVGYISRYGPGLRENGGVYMHAATWGVLALARQGLADDALRIFRKLNPILQAQKDAKRYKAEPYVLPGNVDGKDSQFYGRGGWTWYTGSAGWLFSIAVEAICGVQPVLSGLMLNPCIPADWLSLRIRRNFRGATYDITIENPNRVNGGVQEIMLNSSKIAGNVIPPQKSGTHEVRVVLSG